MCCDAPYIVSLALDLGCFNMLIGYFFYSFTVFSLLLSGFKMRFRWLCAMMSTVRPHTQLLSSGTHRPVATRQLRIFSRKMKEICTTLASEAKLKTSTTKKWTGSWTRSKPVPTCSKPVPIVTITCSKPVRSKPIPSLFQSCSKCVPSLFIQIHPLQHSKRVPSLSQACSKLVPSLFQACSNPFQACSKLVPTSSKPVPTCSKFVPSIFRAYSYLHTVCHRSANDIYTDL